jgi:uncharacterized protein (TIGR03000 family)
MFRYGLATALAAALALYVPAYAGGGGGGHGGGGHGGGGHGGGHGGGGHGGGGHGSSFHGGNFHRGFGGGVGFYGYGLGYPYYYGSYGSYPYGDYYAGGYPYADGAVAPQYNNYNNGYADDPSLYADGGVAADGYRRFYPPLPMPTEVGSTARVRVVVPEDAKLWFDGAETRQAGAERVFETPTLKTGKEYRYELKARWTEDGKPVERSKSVYVRAGRESVVDLTAGD